MSLDEKVSDLRWHVATTGHREFAVTTDYLYDGGPPMDSRFHLPAPEAGGGDQVWIITCCGQRDDILEPVTCSFERRISESEIAASGRMDLTDRYGIGALVESVKLEARREPPKAWAKVGELDIGDDPDPV